MRGKDLLTWVWNINHLAFFACIKRDPLTARDLVDIIEEPIILSAWWSNERNYALCKNWLSQMPDELWKTKDEKRDLHDRAEADDSTNM